MTFDFRNIVSLILILVFAGVPLMAQDKTAQENSGTEQQGPDRLDDSRPNAGIIKEISIESVTIGSEVYQLSDDIAYYLNNGNRVTRVDFRPRDGVLFTLNKEGKVNYMKKIPR